MSRFANENIRLTPSHFIRQCKMNIQNCHFFKHGHVRCPVNWIQDFIWCCILNRIFFWLNRGKNADAYITKLKSIKHQRVRCWPGGQTIFLKWAFLFLPHQNNVMDHSWVVAMNHICKNKKPYLYVHKKTSKKLSRPSNLSLGKWRSLSLILVFTHYPVQVSFTQIQQ